MGYCEFVGGVYKIHDFAITHAIHSYKMVYDDNDDYWDCYADGSFKSSHSFADTGMSQGLYVNAQGEAHQFHVQIGKMAPDYLNFLSIQRRVKQTGSWTGANFSGNGPIILPATPVYGASVPAADDLRVWTNAH